MGLEFNLRQVGQEGWGGVNLTVHQVQDEAELIGGVEGVRHTHDERAVLKRRRDIETHFINCECRESAKKKEASVPAMCKSITTFKFLVNTRYSSGCKIRHFTFSWDLSDNNNLIHISECSSKC